MAMMANDDARKTWGFHQIMDSYNTERTRLFKEYGFQFRDLVKLVNLFHPSEYAKKYRKYKRLFNITLCVLIIVVLATILGVLL
jgi:cupin superfamily acireductone dioxygenase involved in methionine salvage